MFQIYKVGKKEFKKPINTKKVDEVIVSLKYSLILLKIKDLETTIFKGFNTITIHELTRIIKRITNHKDSEELACYVIETQDEFASTSIKEVCIKLKKLLGEYLNTKETIIRIGIAKVYCLIMIETK
jgi:hypothetical protein